MRITDEEIIEILANYGPATVLEVAQYLKTEKSKHLTRKMRMLVKYKFLERRAVGRCYLYALPGTFKGGNQ